jgi:hypothetical protein
MSAEGISPDRITGLGRAARAAAIASAEAAEAAAADASAIVVSLV